MPTLGTISAKKGLNNTEYISASAHVFSMAELLTQILEGCAAHDLLCHLPRVNSTFNDIINNNKSIQQKLFFTPLQENGIPTLVSEFEINPFLKYLAFEEGAKVKEGCDYDWGPGPITQEMIEDGDDLSSNDMGFASDDEVETYLEFDWDKVVGDERFLREEASWKRMLPVQPPSREVWNSSGGRVDGGYGREVRPKSVKMLGKTWESVKIRRDNPCCTRLRSFIRSSERFGVVLMTNVDIWNNTTEEQIQIYAENNGYMLSHWPHHEE
ncbi:hypothetical protein EDB80DRAFT_717640 [Ilyonectria destructans]|nr:hypothetical protein EDB80DRAFT_717640 [Ilyonectria destructans]